MDYAIIIKAVPIVVLVTPYLAQLVKMAFAPIIKGHHEYDNLVRGIVSLLAAAVGAASLYFMGFNPLNMRGWIITILTLLGYATGGSIGAMSFYAMINGYMHQTPPANPILPSVTAPETNTTGVSDNQNRQPY